MVAGLALALVLNSLPSAVASVADLYLQFFFIPPALFTFFIAGLVAPRAGYVVGLIYGVIAGVIWSIAILATGLSTTTDPTTPATAYDAPTVVLNMLAIGVIYGVLATVLGRFIRRLIDNLRAA